MKRITTVAIAGLISLGSAPVFAADDPAAAAIKYRKAIFSAVKYNFAPMGAMVKGQMDYDKDKFAHLADNVAMLAKMSGEGFIPGSDKGDTEALPAVWTEHDKFMKGIEKFQQEAANLASVAKGGDMNAIKPAFGEVGKTCKGCHDNFKKD